jgi:RNA polymerase sigma-70 factor (ECF subfamily)
LARHSCKASNSFAAMKSDDLKDNDFNDRFRDIYLSHLQGMIRFADEYVGDWEEAENIVQDAFAEIWETRSRYVLTTGTLLSLIFSTIKNKCIDYLRHQMVVRQAENFIQEEYRLEMQLNLHSLEAFDEDLLSSGYDLEELIAKAIDALPEKCRKIFIMSKIEGKKQKDIAKELDISINTVETQMSAAYKKLREELKGFLPLLLFLVHL